MARPVGAGDAETDPWLWTVTVLTTTATDDLGRIHDRMPLLVEKQRYAEWLDPAVDDPDELRGLLVPAAPGPADGVPGRHDVNNVKNNGPELVDPLPAEGEPTRRRAGCRGEPRLLLSCDASTTPVGAARVRRRRRGSGRCATLVLGHGAGGGIGAADLVALADRLPAHGIEVVRVEQPWRVAGRKVAAPPPTLDRAWLAVLEQLSVDGPLLVGGRSAGARVACRTASDWARTECSASRSRCIRRAGRRSPAWPSWTSRRPRVCRRWWCRAPGTRSADRSTSRPHPGGLVVPVEGADHSLRRRQGGRRLPARAGGRGDPAWARQVAAG